MRRYRNYLLYVGSIVLFCFALYPALFYLQLGAPTESSRYIQEWFNVKMRYAQRAQGPKLVFVSGSNTLFGIDTAELEARLGLPALNLGSHAGLGLRYILRQARQAVGEGDIVVLPLEYEQYEPGKWEEALVDYIAARDPAYFKELSAADKLECMFAMPPKRLLRGVKARFVPDARHEDSAYDSRYLNANGDMTNNAYAKRTPAAVLRAGRRDAVFAAAACPDREAAREISAFIAFCRARGARVLAAYPSFLYKDKAFRGADLERVQEIAAFYATAEVPVLGDYAEFLYDADDFYDTAYHLNDRGKGKRTRQLLSYLRPYVAQGG